MYEDIKSRFEESVDNYESIKAETEKTVVRWRYSKTRHLWDYEPEWQGVTRAYIDPTHEIFNASEADYAYGYNSEDQVICKRHYDTAYTYIHHPEGPEKIPHRELRIEYFIRHIGNFLEALRFLTPHNYTDPTIIEHHLQFIDRVWTENGKVIETEQYRDHSGSDYTYSHDLYYWEGEMLKLIQCLDTKNTNYQESEVDENGRCTHYYILKNGRRFLMGQPLPKGVTVKQLFKTVREILLERIPRAVEAAKIQQPIYCLVLSYEGEGNEIFSLSFASALSQTARLGFRTANQKSGMNCGALTHSRGFLKVTSHLMMMSC
jgi:hypothetical protein